MSWRYYKNLVRPLHQNHSAREPLLEGGTSLDGELSETGGTVAAHWV